MLNEAEEQRVVRAIANAERGNRGEVRVHIERLCPLPDPLERAKRLYRVLKLDGTRDDTGVLLYIASKSKQVAVYGGAGVDAQADEDFWQGVTDAVARGFRARQPADGICDSLSRIGKLLRQHLGGDDLAGNELPDAVTTDSPSGTAGT